MTAARARSPPMHSPALLAMAARGERTYCTDAAIHHLWVSEDPHEPRIAVKLCGGARCSMHGETQPSCPNRRAVCGRRISPNQFIGAAIERGGAVTEWLRSLTNRGVLPLRLDVRIKPASTPTANQPETERR
jgi:hypothetical protein